MSFVKLFGLATLAMVAFAGNSILNRFALVDGELGAWSFTLIRLISGAVMLAMLTKFRVKDGSFMGAISLLIYAGGFSYAYITMDAGLGALILFAMVQFTMLGAGVQAGERLTTRQWCGAGIAFAALIWLLWPNHDSAAEAAPAYLAIASMSAAGIGWGVYSLVGRGAANPLLATAGNFTRAAIIALILTIPALFFSPEIKASWPAITAAVASGALTSGVGYAIWYTVLPKLTRSQAGIMQLSVPAIASIGGVIFLSEVLTQQVAISTTFILLGVGLATVAPKASE